MEVAAYDYFFEDNQLLNRNYPPDGTLKVLCPSPFVSYINILLQADVASKSK